MSDASFHHISQRNKKRVEIKIGRKLDKYDRWKLGMQHKPTKLKKERKKGR
jgi:hypothetical protein